MSALSIIRDKKQTLARQIDRHEEMLAKLRTQLADFEAAERVLIALGDDGEEAANHGSNGSGQNHVSENRKPSGLRPVPEMIMDALEKARSDGRLGLTPTELLSFVREHYWPDAQPNDVGSTAWRMWKAGRLVKPDEKSSIYSLPGAKRNAA
jgi:hypothetical protein